MESFTQGLWRELQQTIFSTPLIGHMTDSLDTGQTEDDAFNPQPIDPALGDSQQLTGEFIQPYLSLVGQLHSLVTLPCPNSSQLQGSYKGSMAMSRRPLISIGSSPN